MGEGGGGGEGQGEKERAKDRAREEFMDREYGYIEKEIEEDREIWERGQRKQRRMQLGKKKEKDGDIELGREDESKREGKREASREKNKKIERKNTDILLNKRKKEREKERERGGGGGGGGEAFK